MRSVGSALCSTLTRPLVAAIAGLASRGRGRLAALAGVVIAALALGSLVISYCEEPRAASYWSVLPSRSHLALSKRSTARAWSSLFSDMDVRSPC
jgi:hypothetical protein